MEAHVGRAVGGEVLEALLHGRDQLVQRDQRLFVGALGRLALPGPDPMSIGQTILIGVAASFAAGLV